MISTENEMPLMICSQQCYSKCLRLRSQRTIFRKLLKTRADLRHTNPLRCSECKKSLLVSKQITYTRVQAGVENIFLFLGPQSEIENFSVAIQEILATAR